MKTFSLLVLVVLTFTCLGCGAKSIDPKSHGVLISPDVDPWHIANDYYLPYQNAVEGAIKAQDAEQEYLMSFGYNPEHDKPSLADIQRAWEKKEWRQYAILLDTLNQALYWKMEKQNECQTVLENNHLTLAEFTTWYADEVKGKQ